MTPNEIKNAKKAMDEAIDIAGGPSALAQAIGVSRQAMSNFRASMVPAKRCKAIEQATGVAATRLRPDVFLMPQQ